MSGHVSEFGQPQQSGGPITPSDVLETALCPGARFGLYALEELIGVGHTASVYRAHDTRLLRQVAIKVLNSEGLAGAEGLARFLHEARMAAAIRHPNVVSMFDVGAHDGKPYIVMELLTGEDLDARLSAVRVLREPVLIDMAVQLASGLAAVHDAGVVHRDVRPANVFLARGPDASTQPKLLDFGGSKHTRDNRRLTTNGRRRWAAMPLYAAPEVLLDGEASFLSDQYSLGVLLFECATGVHPFRADTVRESVELITSGRARRIADQPLQPSRRLARIIERAMHYDPAERFADMRELGRALASVKDRGRRWPWRPSAEASVAHAASATPAAKPRQAAPEPAQRSSRGLGWAIGATVIACSIGAPVWAWCSARRPRAPAPIRVVAPLAPREAPIASAPLPSACAPVAPSEVRAAPPAVAPVALAPVPALDEPAAASPPPLPPAPQALPEHPAAHAAAAPSALLPLQPAPPAPPPIPGAPPPAELAASGAAGEGASGEAMPAVPIAPAAEGDGVDTGIPAAPDAGVLEPGHTLDALPAAAAPADARELGTNGALIFD